MRNRFVFRVGKGADLVTLISRPTCIEIVLTKKSQASTEFLCTHVRSVMESTLLRGDIVHELRLQPDIQLCP